MSIAQMRIKETQGEWDLPILRSLEKWWNMDLNPGSVALTPILHHYMDHSCMGTGSIKALICRLIY